MDLIPMHNQLVCTIIVQLLLTNDAAYVFVLQYVDKLTLQHVSKFLALRDQHKYALELCRMQGGLAFACKSPGSRDQLFEWAIIHLPKSAFDIRWFDLDIAYDHKDSARVEWFVDSWYKLWPQDPTLGRPVLHVMSMDRADVFALMMEKFGNRIKPKMMEIAVEHGAIQICRYLFTEKKLPFDMDVCETASRRGDFRLTEFAHQCGMKLSTESGIWAVYHNDIKHMDYLLTNGFDQLPDDKLLPGLHRGGLLSVQCVAVAFEYERMEILEWIHTRRPITHLEFLGALFAHQPAAVAWCIRHDIGTFIPECLVSKAHDLVDLRRREGNLDMIRRAERVLEIIHHGRAMFHVRENMYDPSLST